MTSLALSFNDIQFDVVDRNNQPWLKLPQVAQVLYTKGGDQSDAPFESGIRQVQKLYQRHADEFTDSMTALVELDTAGGKQQVRIFSLRGCHLLAMFARTEVAKKFRKWVLDVLEQHTQGVQSAEPKTKPKPPKAIPAPETMPWSDWYIRFDVDLGTVTGDGFEAGQALARCWLHELRREALAGVDSHNGRTLLLMGLLKRLAEFPPEDIRNPHRAGGSAEAKTLNRLLAGFCWALDEYAKRCIVQEPEEPDFDPVALSKRYFTLPRRRAVRSAAPEGGQRPDSQPRRRRTGVH